MFLITSSKQKKMLLVGLGIVLLLLAGGIALKLTVRGATSTELTTHALTQISSGIDAYIGGHPLDSGYEPAMLMGAYPGLVSADFDGAQATQGWYYLQGSALAFHSTAGNTISTAERGLTIDGIMHVLHKAAARLSLRFASERDINALLARLATHTTKDTPGIPVSVAQVPDGWYAHDMRPEGASADLVNYVVLTKHKDLPQRNPSDAPYDTPQITVAKWHISVSPEQQVQQEGLGTSDTIDAGMDAGRWNTYGGHKMFVTTLQEGGDAISLFGGDTMYEFSFVGDSADRTDLWKVITYYASQPSFPMISRAETLANCKSHDLPPGQEYDILADPETGYVTLGYFPATPKKNPREVYLFLNYNDDLSQCSPNIHRILTSAKQGGDTMTQ